MHKGKGEEASAFRMKEGEREEKSAYRDLRGGWKPREKRHVGNRGGVGSGGRRAGREGGKREESEEDAAQRAPQPHGLSAAPPPQPRRCPPPPMCSCCVLASLPPPPSLPPAPPAEGRRVVAAGPGQLARSLERSLAHSGFAHSLAHLLLRRLGGLLGQVVGALARRQRVVALGRRLVLVRRRAAAREAAEHEAEALALVRGVVARAVRLERVVLLGRLDVEVLAAAIECSCVVYDGMAQSTESARPLVLQRRSLCAACGAQAVVGCFRRRTPFCAAEPGVT